MTGRIPLSENHRMRFQKITYVQSLTNRSILKTIELTELENVRQKAFSYWSEVLKNCSCGKIPF